MDLCSFRLSLKLPMEPARIYAAWLDGRQHAAFTGGPAKVDPRVGGHYSAWGDYIQGTTLDLEPGRRIVQTWRASEFPPDAADSRVEVLLEGDGKGGTVLTLVHTELPSALAGTYEKGWEDYYFKPMKKYFRLLKDKADLKAKAAARKTAATKSAAAARAAAKKTAAKKAPLKKTTAKKTTAKKTTAKKTTAKKTTAKKTAAKKTTAKKPLAKKSPAKKPAA